MKQSDSITNLAKALVLVQQNVTPITKDRVNPHFNATYATFDAIMETIRPLLAGQGLAIVQGGAGPVTNVDGNVCGVSVETMILHASGEYVSSIFTLPLDKPSAQAVGSAITYGRRYGVSSLLALTTEEDDDGSVANANAQNTQPKASAPKLVAGEAASKKMPFGDHKGKPLGEIPVEALRKTVAWAQSDAEKAEKFKDLIAACTEVIHARSA